MSTDVRAIISARMRQTYSRGDSAEDHAAALLADFAAHGVEVIADLPDVEVEGGVVQSGSTWTPRGHPPGDVRRHALEWLAIARHLELEAQRDDTNAAALTQLVAEVQAAGGPCSAEDIGRYLSEAGVRHPQGGPR